MGRHSSPEQSTFYRSLFGWFLPWVLVAAVAGVAVWIAIGAIGRGPLEAAPPQSGGSAQTSAGGDGASPEPRASASPTPERTAGGDGKEHHKRNRGGGNGLITAGVSVQVLDATSSSRAGEHIADRLSELGFEIVAVGRAARFYDDTTVFWSSASSRAAARALANRFGWKLDPAPSNLSHAVDVHVVVGADEA